MISTTTTTSRTQLVNDSSVEWQKRGLVILALLLFSAITHAQLPELFKPGSVSTKYKERDMTISPEGDHLLYSIHSYDDSHRLIVEMKLRDDGWSEPEVVQFSGQYKDLEPMFDPKGERLFFVSNRPMFDGDQSRDYNIWYVPKSQSGWGEAVAIDTLINTGDDEFYPSLSNSGTLYYTATRDGGIGKEDIFYSTWSNGSYQRPVAMDTAVNSKTYEFNSFIDPNERYLLFSSYGRPDGLGGGDLYIAYKVNGKWTSAINLGEQINSSNLDYCPFVSADGKTFYYTSNRRDKSAVKNLQELRNKLDNMQNGYDNIYFIPMTEVPRKP